MNIPRAEGAPRRGALHQQAMVSPAQQLVFPQRELVPRQKVSGAHRAPETLHVVHVVASSHHQVAAAEANVTFCTFNPK